MIIKRKKIFINTPNYPLFYYLIYWLVNQKAMNRLKYSYKPLGAYIVYQIALKDKKSQLNIFSIHDVKNLHIFFCSANCFIFSLGNKWNK